ncbi:energy transducer TonB [Xanthobacteraceae bacterium A53D]
MTIARAALIPVLLSALLLPAPLAAQTQPGGEGAAPPAQAVERKPLSKEAQAWTRAMTGKLQRLRRMPRDKDIAPGTYEVRVRMLVDAQGVITPSIAHSSGNASIDAAGLDLVKRASPLPPLPKDYGTQHTFVLPLIYEMTKRTPAEAEGAAQDKPPAAQ